MATKRPTRKKISEAFGQALWEARLEAGMTQEQLADAARLHRTTIGLFERGLKCPSLDTILQLAGAMGTRGAALVEAVEREQRRA